MKDRFQLVPIGLALLFVLAATLAPRPVIDPTNLVTNRSVSNGPATVTPPPAPSVQAVTAWFYNTTYTNDYITNIGGYRTNLITNAAGERQTQYTPTNLLLIRGGYVTHLTHLTAFIDSVVTLTNGSNAWVHVSLPYPTNGGMMAVNVTNTGVIFFRSGYHYSPTNTN